MRMGNLWIKIRAFTKIGVLAILTILMITFIVLNIGAVVEPRLSLVFVSYDRPNLLLVLLLTSIMSIAGWLLAGTVFRTVRQLREMREKNRAQRMEREVAEMKSKASRLQTRPEPPSAPTDPQ
jgi:uncharacterized integral membrane protein